MKIFFDCTILQSWQGHFTGIQRVIYSLARGFDEIEGLRVIPIIVESDGCAKEFNLESFSVGSRFEVSAGDVVLTAAPNWDFSDNESNLNQYRTKKVKIVSVLYDLTPWKLPHSFGPGFPDIYNTWLKRMVLSSDAIASISESSLRDLESFCDGIDIKIPPTTVFRLGDDINEFSTLDVSEDAVEKLRLKHSSRFILSVGTIEYRKNHILLLNAFRHAALLGKELPFKLYIVGKEGWLNSDIRYQIDNDPQLKDHIEILEGVSDLELDYLYKNCEFTVYPSIYEGWGLPVAESLNYGKVCVSSNSSSLVEISPDLVQHLNPFDTVAWSAELIKLSDPERLAKLTQQVREKYPSFSWKESSRELQRFITLEFS
ncbi:glycosyltransferase family 4 protein [Vibrio minamisatsumaniensis]|uniref:glycosyltransferase family 4 protein n=1 Tax=Vibrio minamisatsumaniensis TaxID=2910243 RepID=UPI003D1EA1B0